MSSDLRSPGGTSDRRRRSRRRLLAVAILVSLAGAACYYHFYLYLGWRALQTARNLGWDSAGSTGRYVSRVLRDFDLCQDKETCIGEIAALRAEVDGAPGVTDDKRLLAVLES